MKDPESIEVSFPLGGVDTSGEFSVQRPGTTPVGINVRGSDPILERDRGGSRPGLEKHPTEQIPEGAEVFQHLFQLVRTDTDFLLTSFEDYQSTFILDTSSGARNPGRSIPPTGSGVQPNRNSPGFPRRRVTLTASTPSANNGVVVTLTAALTRLAGSTVVAGQTVVLLTQPPGKDGHGVTAVTNGSGQAAFLVSESKFEGPIRYLVAHEYTPPI